MISVYHCMEELVVLTHNSIDVSMYMHVLEEVYYGLYHS